MARFSFDIGGVSRRDLDRYDPDPRPRTAARAAGWTLAIFAILYSSNVYRAIHAPRDAGGASRDAEHTIQAAIAQPPLVGLVGSGQPAGLPRVIGASTVGAPNCDCMGLDWGLLTGPYRDQCGGREQQLLELAAKGALNLQLDEKGTIAAGEFCDPVASGPRAWPVQGAPARPPAGVPRFRPCRPSGLTQRCDP